MIKQRKLYPLERILLSMKTFLNSADSTKISYERLLVDCKDQAEEDQSVVIMLEGKESKLLFTETNSLDLVSKVNPIFFPTFSYRHVFCHRRVWIKMWRVS